MKTQESFAYVVGVDVSKAKLDIALPKESLTIKNNAKAIQQLVDRIESDDAIVVMEATGGYENRLVQVLHNHDIALAVVNRNATQSNHPEVLPSYAGERQREKSRVDCRNAQTLDDSQRTHQEG